MKENHMHSGELASYAGVDKETIRFYERKGLLPEPKRSSGGYRNYSRSDLKRLIFIRNAKQLGFSLKEIKELLAIADGDIVKCSDVKRIAESKLQFVNAQIRKLAALKGELEKLIFLCSRSRKLNGCPIVDRFSECDAIKVNT